MSEETQEVPKWLKELEEKRERRLKARLGHEAGAGSPCLTCEEKCPGLDLHFWRKICKNCKCGKENHDVNDDDIYGWAQFQLLGSKPNKGKKFVIPGRKDAVDLEWMPKGQNDAVESYLKDLPVNLLPIKGSAAAQERKQLLQKQIPLHDIDPTLCHALSENEVKQMNDYIAHVKQNSVGVGHLMKLNELLKNRRSANAQILSSRAPMQLPQVQNIALQGMDRSNMIRGDLHKALHDLSLDELKAHVNQDQEQLANVNVIRSDLHKALRDLSMDELRIHGQQDQEQFPANVNMVDLLYDRTAQVPQELISNKIDHQAGTNPGRIRDINYPTNKGSVKIPNHPINSQIEHQVPANMAALMDLRYPVGNQNIQNPNQLIHNKDYQNPCLDHQNPCVDHQNPCFGGIKDLHYPANQMTGAFNSANSKNLPHFAKSSMVNTENVQKPTDCGNIRNVYPDMNVNFEVGDLKTNPELLDNIASLKGDANMPHYAPGRFNTFVEQQNPQRIGNIKDLAYSTYDPHSNLDLSNENLQGGRFDPKYTKPANYNPNELNLTEQNLNPTSVNVGIINDIEYPTIKAAVQRQNDIFELNVPRKNVQFDLSQNEEILPTCHKCKKMFDAAAVVIGIDRTDALWHAECFKCSGCNQNLADLMYFYNKESDDIYCGRDYAKIRGIPRCQACDELIFVKEYCLAENSTFHVKHFCCFECDEPLAGQNYVMEDSQPLCLPCFEKVKAEKCNVCLRVIKPDEQGASLNGVHFHADDSCFSCRMCRKPLLGGKLLFKNRNLYCSAQCFSSDK